MQKLNKEDFQKRLDVLFPEEPVLILNYTKASAPCTYKCLICGKEYKIYRAGDLQRKKHLCNECWYGKGKGEKTKINKDKALKIISENKDIEFISFGYNSKLMKPTIKFECLKCGSISELQLTYFLKRQSCPHCTYNAKHLNTTGIKARLSKEHTLLEEYTGTDDKILVRHEECGFIWKTTVHGLLQGYGCPKCSKRISKGEKKIIHYLQENGFIFEREKTFEWCGHRRYDFYLPQENLVIEYMGIQHFKEVPHFKLTLKEQQEIDSFKKEKALSNNLDYFEISYEDFNNIDSILAQRLSR